MKKDVRYRVPGEDLVFDQYGSTVDLARELTEQQESMVVRDGPTMEVRDVRDFFFPGTAVDLQKAPFLVDRAWVPRESLMRLQEQGVYENVEYLTTTSPRTGPHQSEREQKLRGIDRTRGLIEVLEFWNEDNIITVANRQVLLRKRPNGMFWHGRYPFVVTSALPDLFQIPGISIIEGLAQAHDMLWTLTNTRLDMLQMQPNIITLIRSEVDNRND